MSCEYCTDTDGAACFPQYGIAPHEHAYDSVGQVIFGRTVILPAKQWPTNFREEPVGSGQGVYWCPHCGDGKPATTREGM